MNDINVIEIKNLKKSYEDGQIMALTGINLQIKAGETISIVGSSGSGKSTLLHVLAGLDKLTQGEVIVDGQNLSKLKDQQICTLRNHKLGFIYQFHHLLLEFTALENILMPLAIAGRITKETIEFAKLIASRLGIFLRLNHFPSQLSGGERQRVAIARALINNPKLIFADEPTGNLDNTTANIVLDIFLQLQQELKTSVILVTHDINIAKQTNICYKLAEGHLIEFN